MPDGSKSSRAAVFLDRDGVLNEVVHIDGVAASPRSLAELVLSPEAATALPRLHAAGFLLIVVTNQPDIARGHMTEAALDAIHSRLVEALPIDAIFTCRHDGGCTCRKPLPGLLEEAAVAHDLDTAASWMIGDRWIDVATAVAAGVQPVLLERPWSWAPTSQGEPPPALDARYSAATLAECADFILQFSRPRAEKERA